MASINCYRKLAEIRRKLAEIRRKLAENIARRGGCI
jgi:hypothetical protein